MGVSLRVVQIPAEGFLQGWKGLWFGAFGFRAQGFGELWGF